MPYKWRVVSPDLFTALKQLRIIVTNNILSNFFQNDWSCFLTDWLWWCFQCLIPANPNLLGPISFRICLIPNRFIFFLDLFDLVMIQINWLHFSTMLLVRNCKHKTCWLDFWNHTQWWWNQNWFFQLFTAFDLNFIWILFIKQILLFRYYCSRPNRNSLLIDLKW